MMSTKIENQEQYEAQIKYFKEKYIKDFKEKINVLGCDKAYVRDRFKRDILEPRMNEIFNTKNINDPHHFRNQKKWLYGIKTFDAVRQFCEERKPKKDFQLILQALTEYDAILNHFDEIIILESDLPESQNKIVTPDEFISKIQNEENVFCKSMPLKIPIEHFKIFVDIENRNGNPYLSKEQFISFIKRVFLNDKSIDKISFDIGSRGKLFVIKRFYEFYQKAIRFENTNQCRDKYIKLVSDNFTNWDYKDLKDNFGNKVKREW